MRNHQWDRNHNTNTRPLPSCLPEYIPVEIWRSEFKGREQWIAKYKVYHNGRDSDYVDFVINENWRWISESYRPCDGDVWWVKPTVMAPQKRLIFADFVHRGDLQDLHVRPFPHRVGQEFECSFEHTHEQSDVYEASWDNWTIQLKTSVKLDRHENMRVRVTDVPNVFDVKVELIDYADRVEHDLYGRRATKSRALKAPAQLGYLQVESLEGSSLDFEGDVVAYSVPHFLSYGAQLGGAFQAVVETDDDVQVLTVEHLRRKWYGDAIIGTVTLSGREHGQLCELVWVEGEPTTDKPFYEFERARRRNKPTTAEQRADEEDRLEEAERRREEWDQIEADYQAEICYNSERPDYD